MKKILLCACGWILIALAALGIFLPVLPTTPFVIVAAACFSIGSPKICRLLEKNSVFGPYIENWRTKQGIPFTVKIKAISTLWILLILSALIAGELSLTLLLAIIGIGVTIHLLLIKSKE